MFINLNNNWICIHSIINNLIADVIPDNVRNDVKIRRNVINVKNGRKLVKIEVFLDSNNWRHATAKIIYTSFKRE